MAANQAIQACRHGQDDQKFKLRIGKEKEGDLSDLEYGIFVYVR